MKKLTCLAALLLLLTQSCTTDFEVNGTWKPITIVYGIINQNDSLSRIKINKAFLGEGDALQMAMNRDSNEYPYKLDVRIQEWANGQLVKTFPFDTMRVADKAEGPFYYPVQTIYAANTLNQLNQERTYKLLIDNPVTGESFMAETGLVYPFTVDKPKPTQSIIDFSEEGSTAVEWRTGKNGRRYQLMIRFNYKELPLSGGTDTVFKSMDWLFPAYKSTTLNGNEEMNLSYSNPFFYDLVKARIPADPQLRRFFGKKGYGENDSWVVEFFFSVASDEFSTYLDVFEPSTGIIQEKPQFTNLSSIPEGSAEVLGIFSSRYQVIRKFKLGDLTKQKIQSLNLGF
ncbi:MAG TPA: hypothetical protein P5531_07905 [Bacteroidales bacterium]|nr:hypothetical protein [Bacteroidales bacterium]HSA43449.1 hypothetical protein [Bacteroidales bacterium]